MIPDPRVSIQYGYFVQDLEEAMGLWRARADVGPFFVMEGIKVENVLYRGEPSELVLSAALAQFGSVQIELLRQDSSAPSAFTERASDQRCALHHIGYLLAEADAEIARFGALGHPVVTKGLAFGEMPFSYIDTVGTFGHMVEISPNVQGAVDMYETVRAAAVDWDGSDPVRYLNPGA